ncbi:excisionase family DNA-binding protein [Aeromicrobium stalagmiti]|uniref:excisionase family DNA-binding protein n=1 Tax=Aeromicrobium stalagmiti TaxID=2738988 RepID=UPI001568BDD8|nr:excisionase family DNA-binding protein [Aeromicrobium stalagmiti]
MSDYQRRSWRIKKSEGISIVTGRVAAIMHERLDLAELRRAALGSDPELHDQLLSLHEAALEWRASATGSAIAPEPEVPRESKQWMSTGQVASQLGITDRAVRLAIARSALKATEVGGRYRITREDMEHYRAARAA